VTTAGSREGAEVYFRDKGMTDDLSGRVRAVLETIDADFRADRADCAPSLGAGATVAGGTATPGKEARRV
jgi:hypothetical protein